MDADEIRTLLGDNIFERAKKYRKRIQQSTCTVNADGVRHISAMVQGSGGSYYYTQAWLRENGSFVSASCSCPYNQNGEGTYCKHIGALLLDDAEKNAPAPAAKPDAIPGVVRGAAGLAPEPARRDSYASGLEMLFGKSGAAGGAEFVGSIGVVGRQPGKQIGRQADKTAASGCRIHKACKARHQNEKRHHPWRERDTHCYNSFYFSNFVLWENVRLRTGTVVPHRPVPDPGSSARRGHRTPWRGVHCTR